MSLKSAIIDPAKIDFDHILADIEEIREFLPQRYEMEQLTAVVYEDLTTGICAGYKDLTLDDFWVRGHMPGRPLMPGVLMLEAAAQLCSFFVQKNDLMKTKMIGFGGIEEVRFRDIVIPGDRLLIVAQLTKTRPGRMMVSRFEGYVRDTRVVDGVLKGIPLPVDALEQQRPKPDPPSC